MCESMRIILQVNSGFLPITLKLAFEHVLINIKAVACLIY